MYRNLELRLGEADIVASAMHSLMRGPILGPTPHALTHWGGFRMIS